MAASSSASLMSADGVVRLATAGPPVLLVAGLLLILYGAVRNKLDVKQTGLYSGIVAVFFGLWILALPELNKRRISFVTTMSPAALAEAYALKPVRYRFGTLHDGELVDSDFDLPDGREPLMVRFDLNSLLLSYETNLQTVIRVARRDADCFDQATRGISPSRVVARIEEMCPASLRPPGRVYE